MKIIFAYAFYDKPLGGAEISTNLLEKELGKNKLKIKILTIGNNSDKKIIGIPFKFVPKKILIIGSQLIDKLLSVKATKILLKEKPNLIHIQDIYILPSIINAALKLKIPVVVTVRDNLPRLPVFSDNLLYKFLATNMYLYRSKTIKKALLNANKIIAISKHIRNNLIIFGIPEEKIELIYNLPPDWKYNNNFEDNNIIFSAGRLKEEKGFHILIKAFYYISNKYKNYKLIIAGEGPYKKNLLKLIEKLNLKNNVSLIGKKNYKEMERLFKTASIIAIPSIYPEPLGRVTLEGMTAGKTIVASNIGASPELIENSVNGYLYPPEDFKELSKIICDLIVDRQKMMKIGKRNRFITNLKFNKNKIIKQTLNLYGSVIDEK
jgi:glycosyltransferase involved in cell wall biosynthesis